MSLSQQIDISEETDDLVGIVQYVAGTDEDNESFWAYVVMRPTRYKEYYQTVSAGEAVDLEEFGDILVEGKGKEPPEEIRDWINKEYGFSEEMTQKLETINKEIEIIR